MISIRKYLDSNDTPAAPEGHGPRAAGLCPDRLSVCLEAYRATLSGIGRAGVEACPASGNSLEAALAAIARSLAVTSSAESIAAAAVNATHELRNWGGSTAQHYRQKAGEVKGMLLAMAQAAESVGERDKRCAQQLQEVTASLQSIASLEDISQIRSSIEKSASELKCSIDRMTAEGKEVLERLQSQVATFEARLAAAEHLASVDALTHLRSRSWIENQIEQRIATADPFSIALLDLDGFKTVNDVHGHVVGDDVLQQFAGELKSACRSTDLVARWGGDEFLVLLDSPSAAARAQMERVSKWVCGSYTVNRNGGPLVLQLRASIGVAEFAPADTMTRLIERADAAMYAGKGEARRSA